MEEEHRMASQVVLHKWSLWNVATVLSHVNHFGYMLKQKFDNTIDVRVSTKSVVSLVENLMKS